MKTTLTKTNLLDLICGTEVPMGGMPEIVEKKYGYWTGGHVDQWRWSRTTLAMQSIEELIWVYNIHQEVIEDRLGDQE